LLNALLRSRRMKVHILPVVSDQCMIFILAIRSESNEVLARAMQLPQPH